MIPEALLVWILVPGGFICAGQILGERGSKIATPGSLEVRPKYFTCTFLDRSWLLLSQ